MRVLSLLVVAGLGGLQAQDMATGEAIFNSNCAICHGNDGRGARGPNLRGPLRSGNEDSDIEAVIRNGLTGTAMPKFTFEDDELKSVVMYIQNWRRGAAPPTKPQGDPLAGKRVYDSQGCTHCHEVGNEGSTFGPSLTRIGASRSYEHMKTSIVEPSADIPDNYRTIRIVTREGKQYRGVWVNEDSFTIQIRLPDESYASFDKQAIKDEVREPTSMMPAYRLSEVDLKNLLAYLSGLVGEQDQTPEPPRQRR
jgi:cytochrome c oxidase cbb3-type subunit III